MRVILDIKLSLKGLCKKVYSNNTNIDNQKNKAPVPHQNFQLLPSQVPCHRQHVAVKGANHAPHYPGQFLWFPQHLTVQGKAAGETAGDKTRFQDCLDILIPRRKLLFAIWTPGVLEVRWTPGVFEVRWTPGVLEVRWTLANLI